jgi:hypothetical protein
MYKHWMPVNRANLEAFLIQGKGELSMAFANWTPVKPSEFIYEAFLTRGKGYYRWLTPISHR